MLAYSSHNVKNRRFRCCCLALAAGHGCGRLGWFRQQSGGSALPAPGGSLCPAACHGGAACVRAVAVGGRGMAVCRPRPWRHVRVAPRRAMPTPWRPAVCKTARFALPNGPFQGAIRAVRQPHSGRLGSQGANSGSGAEQKRHFCFRLQTFLLNLHEISSAQPPGSRSGPQVGQVHRGGAACKPKCDEE